MTTIRTIALEAIDRRYRTRELSVEHMVRSAMRHPDLVKELVRSACREEYDKVWRYHAQKNLDRKPADHIAVMENRRNQDLANLHYMKHAAEALMDRLMTARILGGSVMLGDATREQLIEEIERRNKEIKSHTNRVSFYQVLVDRMRPAQKVSDVFGEEDLERISRAIGGEE